jgi:hypothetical protein
MTIHRRKLHLVMTVIIACAVSGPAVAADELRSTLADQQSVAVTIYNQDLALIKEVRSVTLKSGVNHLAMREVSGRMRPETALLRSLSHAGAITLLEQNFDFDLLTPGKLLEKYVGRMVGVVKIHPTTGKETVERATVLSANKGVVLKIGDRIETGFPGRLVYDSVPENLRDRPTLVMQLENSAVGRQDLELSYLTGGLGWQADYVAELNNDDSRLDLNGWVTLTNRSGTTYPKAKLQLVAGDVNRARDKIRTARRQGVLMQEAAPRSEMAEESLFEYHLYTLDRLTTIADNQTKQVALLNASGVPVKKELVLAGNDYYYYNSVGELSQKMKVGVFVEFENKESGRLGIPLPKGIVRVYKKDRGGNAQFVGEDRIDHTPKNEKVRLRLGNAFDVTADKKQTDFKKQRSKGKYTYASESAYRIVLKNAKKEAVTVTVQEPVPGDWKMIEESHRHTKAAAGTALWRIEVPAGGNTTLRYRVLVRY